MHFEKYTFRYYLKTERFSGVSLVKKYRAYKACCVRVKSQRGYVPFSKTL